LHLLKDGRFSLVHDIQELSRASIADLAVIQLLEEKLKNIDHLPAPRALTLGQFKGEMELKIAMWLQHSYDR